MLLQSFFIIDADDFDSLPEFDLPENAYMSYRITDFSIDKIVPFYKKIFLRQTNYPFCLLIDISQEFIQSEALSEMLISFSFHPAYIKGYFDNPRLLFEVNKPGMNGYVSLIQDAFKSQGYIAIEADEISKSKVSTIGDLNKNIRFDLSDNLQNLSSEFINSFKTLNSADSLFCFFLNDAKALPEAVKTIEKIESTAKYEFPELFALLTESQSLKLKEKELFKRIELLEGQRGSPGGQDSSYNSAVGRYKKQISELLKFYNNEYEILPAWYKRFGHIIKVIMGKRSFKSLFNDNVKKYKD